MDLGIKDLRVLVTAGAAGIGLEIARAFVREGAQGAHLRCRRGGAGRRQEERPRSSRRSVCDVADRAQVAQAVRRCAEEARRARLPGQQCRHRRADRQGRGDQPRGLGPLPRHRHHRPVQLRAAGRAAPQAVQERQHHESVLAGGQARLPAALALCGGQVGRDRLHQVDRHRARPLRHPRQRAAARPRGRRPHPPRDRGQGAAGRHLVQGAGGGACSAPSRSRTT